MKGDLYAEVTARIVVELERGAAPWIKPWSATAAAEYLKNRFGSREYAAEELIAEIGHGLLVFGVWLSF
jgi:antirestriction protein ArdC